MAFVNKRAPIEAAIIAGKTSDMDAVANRAMRNVKAVAAAHRLTGDFINSISVKAVPGLYGTGQEVTDRLVVSTDPGAVPIEYGHMYHHKGSRRVTWVPGIHAFSRGLAAT